MSETFSRPILRVLFVSYLVALFYLLFVFERSLDLSWIVKGGFPALNKAMELRINWIPFKSILGYLSQMNLPSGVRVIVTNIGGHMAAFSWLGYFMPRLWPKYKQRKTFLWTVLAGLVLIEVVQYFTMSGMLDVDDVLLNLAGAYLGFVFLRRPEPLEGDTSHGG